MSRMIERIGLACLVAAAAGVAQEAAASDPAKPVTYCNQVSRILQKSCQQCHRPGQVAPFPLLTYEDAKHWSDTIKEVVQERRMPPWFADRAVGHFVNDRSLSKEEIETITSWIDAGSPKGDEQDLPEPIKWVEGWQIGQPDVVLSMGEEFEVPATGVVPYRYFRISTSFDEDKWVQAVELKAGNPAVVHHILMRLQPPGESVSGGRRRSAGADGAKANISDDELAIGFFAALAPGSVPAVFPKGFGKRIPKGYDIVFQMHYTPNGTEQVDRSSVGLVFAKEPVHTEVRTRGIFNQFFSIPPGADNHEVKSAYRFPRDSVVLAFMPHMHLRGKSFEYEIEYPDGKTEKLLSVPRYDFDWQLTYQLAKPLVVPKGTKLRCTAHFDNSAANKANPDPTKRVGWGDQTWEEMMIGFINYYVPEKPAEPAAAAANASK